jgi:threonine aldolase
MRRIIAEAPVGDDVFGDDPTVNALEEKVARDFGKEASVFVPSGTMANQIALAATTRPGDEVILDRQCHIFNYEVAAGPLISGLQFNALDGESGIITADDIAPHIRHTDIHCPETRLIAIENTHNRAGGKIFPLAEMKAVKALAERHGLTVHLDGARLANASVATGMPLPEYAACADTVNLCFSKGLGAPVGSIMVSDSKTVLRARKIRKRLGGGMRQAGLLAAAANYALDVNLPKLKLDHDHAARIGRVITSIDGMELVGPIETNIIIFRLAEVAFPLDRFLSSLATSGILALPFGPSLVRMVTHLDIDTADIEFVEETLRQMKPQ